MVMTRYVTHYPHTTTIQNSHFKLEWFSPYGVVKTRQHVMWEILAVVQLGKILDKITQTHLLSYIL